MRPEAVILSLAAAFLSSFCPAIALDRPAPVEEPPRPNIVLVISDDQRYDTLGCTGNTVVETPNIDRLAAHGVLFENAYVATSLCAPSRASILTGLYPHGHGINYYHDDGDPLAEVPIFPELLQQSGYETAFIGKWHLPLDGLNPYRGFDHWVGFAGQGKYFDHTLNVDGDEVATQGFLGDVLADYAARFVEKERTRPFFLMLSLKNPHAPYTPPKRHMGLLKDVQVPLPPSRHDPPEGLAKHFRSLMSAARPFEERVSDEQLSKIVRSYLELVPSLDQAFGVVQRSLGQTKQLSRTAIAFISDNGLLLGDHGMMFKRRTFEASIRVPLIFSYPGLAPAGARDRRLVLNVDLAPTLLELAGLPAPAGIHGRSFLPLFQREDPEWRTTSLHYEPAIEGQARPMEYAVRTGRWKYMALYAAGTEEALFDLEDDPFERENLAGDPRHAATLVTMRSEFRALLEETRVPVEWIAEEDTDQPRDE